MDYSIVSRHSIYLEGLKPEVKKALDDAKKTLRLLSQDKRNALMDFILEEREHGALYVYKEMIDALTSAYCVPATERDEEILTFRADLFNDDLREIPNLDQEYPLYLDCKKQPEKTTETIFNYARILSLLKELDIVAFAENICSPDTDDEIISKANRYERLKKEYLKRHDKRYKTDEYYQKLIDESVKANTEALKKGVVEPIEKEVFLKLPEDKIESYIGHEALKELDSNIKAQKVYSMLRYLFIVGQVASIGMAVSNTTSKEGILGWFAVSCLFLGAYFHSEAEASRLPKAKDRRKEAWKIFQEQQNIHS